MYDGMVMGFTLSMLIGPVFFALLQTGIERGFRAGLAYSAGVWASDFLIITVMYNSMNVIANVIQGDQFKQIVGVAGGIILVVFGLASLLTKSEQFQEGRAMEEVSYRRLAIKGFVINTFNPFTSVFWLGVNTMVVARNGMSLRDASLFFGSLLGTLVFTDTSKVLLSRQIRNWMKPHYFLWIRRTSGALLIISGITLLYRIFA